MTRRSKLMWTALLACLGGAAWGWAAEQSGEPAGEFQPNEAVEVIEVKLEVGDGEKLEEPVALDLGLGFPLWLHPMGRGEGETAPFGAVPQETTAAPAVEAGSSVTFTFRLAGESGQDVLQTTPQLLAGVRVSDIARVGFSSLGNGNWTLAGYQVTVNGKPLAAGTALSQRAQESQDNARFRLAELGVEIGPKQAVLAQLQALIETGLASDAEQDQRAQIETELKPLLAEKRRLEKQVEGEYPWFEDTSFRAAGRGDTLVASAKVTLVTQLHPGADTQNYVYFRTGGHKYLLGSHEQPLSGQSGPQEFELDTQAGPLTTGDLRGDALGMLGHPYPYGQAPDRWHPQRLLVEIDQRIVYDSDENPLDQKSLEAIRLIPPVHVDQDALVTNTPVSRETYVWEAGRGLGLDVATQSPLELPEPTDPAYPEPEPGTVEPSPELADNTVPEGDPAGGEPFPGEDIPPDDFGSAEGEGDLGGPEDDWNGGGWGGGGWGGGGWGGWGGGWGWPDDGGIVPDPAGEPVQVTNVRIAEGSRTDDEFVVTWDATGDESTVARYEVYLIPVVPGDAGPLLMGESILIGEAGPGSGVIAPTALSVEQIGQVAPTPERRQELFLAPYVVAVPLDPTQDNTFSEPGPAKAILPAGAGPVPTTGLHRAWRDDNANGVVNLGELTLWADVQPVEPETAGRAVWIVGEERSHNAILFDRHLPGAVNMGFRPEPGDTELRLRLRKDLVGPVAPQRIVAHIGFRDPEAADGVTVELQARVYTGLHVPVGLPVPPQEKELLPPAGGIASPMVPLNVLVDPGPLPAGLYYLRIDFKVKGGGAQALTHPPVLFGVRVLQE